MSTEDFPLVWFWRPSWWRPVDRKGQRCRVVARGKLNTVLVEFADGFLTTTSRYAVRQAKPAPNPNSEIPGELGL